MATTIDSAIAGYRHGYRHWFAQFGQPKNASLAFAIYLALWTMVAWWFYRKKIFVKV